MRQVTLLLRCLLALTCAALAGCSSAAPDAAPSGPTSPAASPPSSPAGLPHAAGGTYLALGDSVAAGVGAAASDTQGYVPVLARLLADRVPLRVHNLAVSGATTTSLLRDQLPGALDVLADADVRLVTVTVGGNDVFLPIVQACSRSVQDPACPRAVRAALEQVDAGVDELLRRITDAAGPAVPVAVMAYYDPLPACRLAALAPLAEQVLEGTADSQGLNDVLRTRAEEHGAVVVETADRLVPPGDFVGGVDCLHPSTSGHARIAEAFLDAVGRRVTAS